MSTVITLTPAATDHIKKMLEQNYKGVGFRLSVKKTGCSGFAYVPDIIEYVNTTDIHFIQDELHVYVDPACETFIKGLIIDYVADATSLKQKRLVFINPNEKNRCGCGESFTIE
jgi:iron-sulfur cluster assembly accessory protein